MSGFCLFWKKRRAFFLLSGACMAVLPYGGKNAFAYCVPFFAVSCLKKCFCRRQFSAFAGSANPAKLGSKIVLPCFYARSSAKRTKKVSRIFKKISVDM